MLARTIIMTSMLVLTACESNDSRVARQAGSEVGKTVTEFASGVREGIGSRTTVAVDLSKDLADRGLSKTISRSLGPGAPKGFTIYLMAKSKLSVTLVARAMTSDGLEIGRSRETVSFDADEAKYVTFKFPAEMDAALVAKYSIEAGR